MVSVLFWSANLGRWLDKRLSEDVPDVLEGVWRGEAPPGTKLPYVIWEITDDERERTAGGTAWVQFQVEVKLVRKAHSDEEGLLCRDTVMAWLTQQLVEVREVFEGLLFRCRPSDGIDYEEAVGQTACVHQGSYFDVWVSDESEED